MILVEWRGEGVAVRLDWFARGVAIIIIVVGVVVGCVALRYADECI